MRLLLKSIPLALLFALFGCGTWPEENIPVLHAELRSINISKSAGTEYCSVPIDIVLSNGSSKTLTVDLVIPDFAIRMARLEDRENGDRWEFPAVTNGWESFDPHPTVTLPPNAKKNCVVYIDTSGKPLALVNLLLIDKSKEKAVPRKLHYFISGIAFTAVNRFFEPSSSSWGRGVGQGGLGNRSGPGVERICVIGAGEVSVR